jgi:hypothetical protein
MAKKLNLTKRYNKDGSVSLLSWKSKVVFKSKDFRSIDAFVAGWYEGRPIVFNKTRFA